MSITQKRRATLDAWLDRVGAYEQWQTVIEHTGATVTGYLINCRVAIVVRYAEGHGWELYVPASDRNRIVDCLDAAAIALKVEGCAGLEIEG